MATTYHLESVDRVMKVLNAFAESGQEPRLTDLSLWLEMPKPQVLRILSTLQAGGYVERDPATKRYRLGLRLFQLGMIVRQQMSLRRVAQPVLHHLAEQTHETVALFKAEPTGAICLDVIESPKGLRIFAQEGRTMPWNAGAAGKVILAYLPEPEREAILAGAKFEQYTPFTVTEPAQLRRVLAEIRETGYAISPADLDPDAIGVSAPVLDAGHRVAGAVSLGAPKSRIANGDLQRVIELVRDGAAEVSRGLGYDGGEVPRPALAALGANSR
jgi:DNA-binding IclR family transcriptional regulator